jgi:aminoglycoside 3-N-acetyltransferase
MDQRGCSRRIAAEIRDLGVLPGNTVLLHSSFKSLGTVPGGIETVILGFLQALGPDGTLLMPALSWALRPPEVFDLRSTPTNVGAIPEYFRTREGTSRSLHPTHSVCAIGKRTHELLDDHGLDCTPCGMHSPLRKVVETNGKIVMLGCGLRPNTTMHALEECIEPPYLFGPRYVFTIRDRQGRTCQKEYKTHGFASHGFSQRYDKVMELDSSSFLLGKGQVLQAVTFILDAPRLKSAVLGKLKEDPYFFVEAVPNEAAGGEFQ